MKKILAILVLVLSGCGHVPAPAPAQVSPVETQEPKINEYNKLLLYELELIKAEKCEYYDNLLNNPKLSGWGFDKRRNEEIGKINMLLKSKNYSKIEDYLDVTYLVFISLPDNLAAKLSSTIVATDAMRRRSKEEIKGK